MEEDEYRSTYRAVNELRCAYEKAILSRRCDCQFSTRFYLADREGIACHSEPANRRCRDFLALLREKAMFSLKLPRIDEQLPHAKEIKVQTGGMLGLWTAMHPGETAPDKVVNVAGLLADAVTRYRGLAELPYQELVKSIVAFEGRPRRGHRAGRPD